MSVLMIMIGAAMVLFLAGRFYAPLIGRVLGEKADRTTPAVEINDGRDYVPTRTPVVFAHHYASIAGAGPIVGPVLAIIYGWGPALLWIILGGIFLGAVHDFAATHISMREGGKNLTVVARRYVGPAAFVMLLILLIALLALVCAAFLDLSATALTSKVALTDLEAQSGETIFAEVTAPHVVTGEEVVHAKIGGVASMSVIVITLCSPLIGFLYLKRKLPVWICSLLALVICGISIYIGIHRPITLQPDSWKLLISAYVLISAGLPVWLFLQSRDFINVHILYVGIVFLFVALITAAIRGGGAVAEAGALPMSNFSEGAEKIGHPGWPGLFVIIACGAVSGFHSLCAGGTTCKQLRNELAARRIGYYAMLLESFLAVCVICCLMVGLSKISYTNYCYPTAAKGNAVLVFAMAVGGTAQAGLGIPVSYGVLGAMLLLEGFLVTTLDTAIRLTRYMIEEGWAVFFGKYDVFAELVGTQKTDTAVGESEEKPLIEISGTGGLAVDGHADLADIETPTVVATSGLFKGFLRFLKLYWVNSGLAVAFMLILGWGKGYGVIWNIFGSSNQLLAALALLIATTWLMQKGRTIWYTFVPTIFMLITSVTMLIRLLVTKYIPELPGTLPLVIADLLILGLTAGLVITIAHRWLLTKAAHTVTNPTA
ncbi:carbon starvation protein A [Planctomycetota bacterium]